MDGLLIICLALSALLIANIVAALAAVVSWRLMRGRLRRWSAAAHAQWLFALRLIPTLSALVWVLALSVPSYIAFEPRPADEVINFKLTALASLSAAGIALTCWRALASWHATRQLFGDWMHEAERVQLSGLAIPAFRFPSPYPVIAAVGIIRPRLFIAGCVFDSLDDHEISAAIAHEAGHLLARDNLRLGLIRICRDAMACLPGGRRLEREWAAWSELAADEHAARAGRSTALDLAAALIKIARLALSPAERPVMPAGVSLIGEDVNGVAQRVQRLIKLAEAEEALGEPVSQSRGDARWAWKACSGGALIAVALVVAAPSLFSTAYLLTEYFFSILK